MEDRSSNVTQVDVGVDEIVKLESFSDDMNEENALIVMVTMSQHSCKVIIDAKQRNLICGKNMFFRQ